MKKFLFLGVSIAIALAVAWRLDQNTVSSNEHFAVAVAGLVAFMQWMSLWVRVWR